MGINRFPGTGAKTSLPTSAVLQLTAADLAPNSVAASELAADAVTAAGGEIADGAIDASAHFAAGVVDAAAIGPDAVGTSEIIASILPWTSGSFRCTKPAVVEQIGAAVANKAVTLTGVYVRCGTLPTNNGDTFSFNIRNAQVGNIFASDQVFLRNPNVTSFKFTQDDGGTYTTKTSEVTDGGAGEAAITALDTVANGDWIVVGYSQPFAGINIDMTATVNNNAATLAAHFWDGSAWQACGSVVDGTDAAGATFAQDGVVTFTTPPGTWQSSTIDGVAAFYIRLSVSAALDNIAINEVDVIRDTSYPYLFTPDQNLTVAAGATLAVNCTEADANADNLEVELVGTVTT